MCKGFIHRDKHDKNYTCISNSVLFDDNLTDTSTVLISRILSIDDRKWDWSKEGLRIKANLKEHAFNNAFKLLRKFGYIVLEEKRKPNGQNSYEWHIYESPYTDTPPLDNPPAANQRQLNNNHLNKKELNNNALNINQSTSDGLIERNFKEQIEFDILENRCADKPSAERKILQDLVSLAVEVLQSNIPTYRIGREEKPRTVVESRLKKLTCEDMEHTAHNIYTYDKPIADPAAFMLTALYKATITTETQSNAKVNAEIKEDMAS